MVIGETLYQTTAYCANEVVILSQRKLQSKTVNLPSYIFSALTLIPQTSFFIHFIELLPLVFIEKS